MVRMFTEESEEERSQQRLGRKKQGNKPLRFPATFKLPPDLIERLEHYIAHRKRVECRKVEKSEVVEEALDKFLRDNDY